MQFFLSTGYITNVIKITLSLGKQLDFFLSMTQRNVISYHDFLPAVIYSSLSSTLGKVTWSDERPTSYPRRRRADPQCDLHVALSIFLDAFRKKNGNNNEGKRIHGEGENSMYPVS